MKHTADQKDFRVKKKRRAAHHIMVGLGVVNPDLTPVPSPDEGALYCRLSPVQFIQSLHGQNLPLKSAEPQHLNGGLPSVMCVWCLCIYSFDFHHSSPLKREYVTAAVTFKKPPLKPHSDYCRQSLSAQCREGNRALSWLLFHSNFIQNVSGIVGPGPNSPSSPASPTPKTHQ